MFQHPLKKFIWSTILYILFAIRHDFHSQELDSLRKEYVQVVSILQDNIFYSIILETEVKKSKVREDRTVFKGKAVGICRGFLSGIRLNPK